MPSPKLGEGIFVCYELLLRDLDAFFFGTLAPFLRASESPIAIACLRLVTRPPCPDFPLFNVPLFRRRMALSTDLDAASLYRRPPDFLIGLCVGIVRLPLE